jgi:RecA/RadA recombinase
MSKKEQDLTQLFVRDMNRHRPTKNSAGKFDFVNCDEEILADVKYVILPGNEPFDTFTGGFPFGRISEIFGLENCGKTALLVRTMCRFQAKHIYEITTKHGFIASLKRVDPARIRLIKAFIDNEGSLERGFKLTIHDTTFNEAGEEVVEHITMENTGIGLCDTIEQVLMAADRFLKVIAQAEKEADEDKETPEEDKKIIFGLFIIDTIAGTSSKDEIEKDWGKRDFPRAAGKISEGFRRLRGEISRHNISMIFSNQVRKAFKIEAPGGYKPHYATPQADDFSTYGGMALAFYATHRIFMFRVPIKYTLVPGAQFDAGYLLGFRTIKNRLRKPMREGRMVLLFDEEQGGLHNTLSILETLIFLKAAKYESGTVQFRFKQFGVATTTFIATKGKKREAIPGIEGRYEWISFYKAHKPDFDKLYAVAIEKANETQGLDGYYKADDKEELDDEEEWPIRPARTNTPKGYAGVDEEDALTP